MDGRYIYSDVFYGRGLLVSFAASFGEKYADRVMAVMPMWSIILVVAGILVFAILGGLLGKTLLKKHFAKAGIA